MKGIFFFRKAFYIIGILLLAGCSRPASRAPDNVKSPNDDYRVALPLFIGMNNPPPVGQEEPALEGEWLKLQSEELGISFEFPPLPGQVSYSANRWIATDSTPAGALISWEVDRSDQSWKYSFAGCGTEYFQSERERQVTDAVRWSLDAGTSKYFIVLGRETTDELRVTPLEVYTRGDGLQALIFTMDPTFSPLPGRAVVMNLPDRGQDNAQCISFYFADKMNLEAIKKVIDSVQLDW